jgi:hypothetical protein
MMIVNTGRRRRLGWLAGVVAAGVLAVGAIGLAATSGSAAITGSPTTAAELSAGTAGATIEASAKVPWSKVGPGWVLAQYSNGPVRYSSGAKGTPVTLYLASPAGVRYAIYTWKGLAPVPRLIAWSGDKTRALLSSTVAPQAASAYEQLTLATGKFSYGRLAGQAQPTGYTLPDGQNILGVTGYGNPSVVATVARYSLTGHLLKVLIKGEHEEDAVYAPNGVTLAVSGTARLELVSNGGGVIRSLPVPGVNRLLGCYPARWWNATTVLATCADRLWLVPISGKKPVALTPQHTSGPDLGDIGGWPLPSGLYLQGLSACGTLQIFRQAANGSVKQISVPHTLNENNEIVSALGARLLVNAVTGCGGGTSLLWFNPATNAVQWVLHAPKNAEGVIGAVVPFYSNENSQF